ncbi:MULTISPECIES: hypothetical protein [unclassified Microcystis]|jgi:hypothetical protein|uniref:hypothetical protein n=1 Tax=unclassified Microcystis TaxID=2643300 RepID=UPI0022C773CE|nr:MULTISPECIES: hypothetical protein [unclassified Microcystis]MCZ8049531.1 hypothetical protein [Microcystis sp. LE19-41.2A]MCZ8287213.1 hypothetical protein [Microcystis sp. LE19-59.1C]
MNDYSSVLYSEKSVLATDCYDLTPLTYEERGILSVLTFLQKFRKRVSPRNPFSVVLNYSLIMTILAGCCEDAIANVKARQLKYLTN